LARTYREDGKNRKEIVVKLGKLTDEEAKHWRDILQMIRRPDSFWTTLDDIVVRQHFTYLDAAVVNAVWDEWKLDDAFDDTGRRDVDVSIIARILTINRCLDPMAKSRTPEWFSHTALPWMLDVSPDLVNPSRIFRELESIEARKEAICSHLYEKMLKESPESMRSVFYDLSTSTFSGSHCVLMKWGRCKEGYRNHVVLALVVNGDGLPFYWEVLPGGTADATTIIWLMEHVRDRLAVSNMSLVFDRGMVSEENLALLEKRASNILQQWTKARWRTFPESIFSILRPMMRSLRKNCFHSLRKSTTTPITERFPEWKIVGIFSVSIHSCSATNAVPDVRPLPVSEIF